MDETYPAPAAGELSGEGEGASPEDQAALIERIKLGDVELFLKLIQPHGKTLHAVCHSILQNDADAEEVAQETLLKALAHLEQLRTYQSFKSWLFQIAINEARRRLREQRFYSPVPLEPGQPDADEADFAPVDFADWRDIPSVTLERKELWAAVSQALRGLEGIYREVFVSGYAALDYLRGCRGSGHQRGQCNHSASPSQAADARAARPPLYATQDGLGSTASGNGPR